MIEKRQFPRFDRAFEVIYTAKNKGSEIQGYSVSSNVSKGGICLPLAKHIKKGNSIDLSINLSEQEKVLATGKVVWTKDIKRLAPLQIFAGLEFKKIRPNSARLLVATP